MSTTRMAAIIAAVTATAAMVLTAALPLARAAAESAPLLQLVQPLAVAAAGHSDPMGMARVSRAAGAAGEWQRALDLAEGAREALSRSDSEEVVAYLEDDSAIYLMKLGRLDEALALSEQAVQRIASTNGAGTPEHSALLATHGAIQVAAGRVADGTRTLENAFAALPNGERRARTALGIARTLEMSSDPEGAGSWLERALKAGPGPALQLQIRVEQAELATETGDLDAARSQIKALQSEDALGRAAAMRLRAHLAFAEGRLADAEADILELITRYATNPGTDVQLTLALESRLAMIYVLTGRLVEAQELYRGVLSGALEAGLRRAHPLIGRTLHGLALTYVNLGAYEEADLLYDRAIESLSESLGEASEAVARSRLEYSFVLSKQGRHGAAQHEAEKAVSMLSQVGSTKPLGLANSALGFALKAAGRETSARARFEEAVGLIEQVDGPYGPDLPPGLVALAEIYGATGEGDMALVAIDRAIDILERISSTGFSGLANAYAVRALLLASDRPRQALTEADRALAVVASRLAGTADQRLLQEVVESRSVFEHYLAVADAFSSDPKVRARMLLASQYPKLSAVAATISASAERTSAIGDELAELLEERQRLTQRVMEFEKQRERELAGLEAASTTSGAESGLADARTSLARLAERIESRYPAFAERAFPRPVEFSRVAAKLGPKEAVFTLLATPGHSYLFLARSGSLAVARSDLSQQEIERLVARVRRSLEFDDTGTPPEFDAEAARQLYTALLAPLEPDLRGVEHLVYVPDRALASLPLGLLVTGSRSAPTTTGSTLQFLQERFALSSLPSLSTLIALRESTPPPTASPRLLGIGHPMLGERASPAQPLGRRGLVQGLYPDLHAELSPLANTVIEINEIASSFEDKLVLFQENASETKLYGLGDLKDYSVIVFATHGLLRDDTLGLPEPALVLTRDAKNDGLLLASEVAGLSLSADWVILSACNTAGPDGSPRADGLSGLAKAFFFAGARALLVSHWEVNSTAAVLLTTHSIREHHRDPGALGRAHALKLSTERFIAGEYGVEATHPAYWAPFVLVGDGAV